MKFAGIKKVSAIKLFLLAVVLTLPAVHVINYDNNVKIEIKHLKKSTCRKNIKFKTEKAVNDYLDGYGDCYKKNITSYKYLSGYSSQSDMFKTSLNIQWQAMPDKIRDMICYYKVPIRIVKKIRDAPGSNGITRSKFKDRSSFYSEIELRSNVIENNALIHECAHSYDDLLYKYMGISSHRKSAKKLYRENPEMYGFYGSTDFKEFYAEMVCNETLKCVETIKTSKLAKYVVKNYRISCNIKKTNGIRTLKIKIPDLVFELDIEPVTVNGKHYYNGKEENDFLYYTGKKIAKIYRKNKKYKGSFDDMEIKLKS